jgi:hypothetical protein
MGVISAGRAGTPMSYGAKVLIRYLLLVISYQGGGGQFSQMHGIHDSVTMYL